MIRYLTLAGAALAVTSCAAVLPIAEGVATFVASPAGQSLITTVEGLFPSLTTAADKAVAAQATQADLAAACGTYSWASALAVAVDPSLSGNAAWTASKAAVNAACPPNAPPTDLNGAVQTVAAATLAAIKAAQAAGVPVSTTAPAG